MHLNARTTKGLISHPALQTFGDNNELTDANPLSRRILPLQNGKELLLKFFEDWDTTISETHTKILAIAEDEKLDPDEKLRLEEELLIELNQFLANLRAEVEKIVKGSPDDIRSLYLTTFNRWRPD